MFDNLLYQNSALQLENDILGERLPGAILLSGANASGKLTCALEIARVLSCKAEKKGEWTCSCSSCLKHKSLINSNVLLTGSRECTLEISAAKKTFLDAVNENASYLQSSRYLFIRSVRKLILRFSSILWDGDDKLSKIASLTSAINEELEEIDFPRSLPTQTDLVKLCDNLEKNCIKLEDDFMCDSVPILHVRNAAIWARISSNTGKKVIIIENADKMLEGVRNALLKILEEPPVDTIFILITTKRGAVMPTILSRVRTYNFVSRTESQQAQVLMRVFHLKDKNIVSIEKYLQTFLPYSLEQVQQCSKDFLRAILSFHLPDVSLICKTLGNFSRKLIFKLFLEQCLLSLSCLFKSSQGLQIAVSMSQAFRICINNVLIYNQNTQSSLEQLVRELLKISRLHKSFSLSNLSFNTAK